MNQNPQMFFFNDDIQDQGVYNQDADDLIQQHMEPHVNDEIIQDQVDQIQSHFDDQHNTETNYIEENDQENISVCEQQDDNLYQTPLNDHEKNRQNNFHFKEQEIIQPVPEDVQYQLAAKWVIEFSYLFMIILKIVSNCQQQFILRKIEQKAEKNQYDNLTLGSILFETFLKECNSNQISFWIGMMKDRYLQEIKCPSKQLEMFITKLIPKQIKLFSQWQFTVENCKDEYMKRYQNTKDIKLQAEEKFDFVYKQQWNKTYPDRILAYLVKKGDPLLNDKFSPLVKDLQSKFTKNLQSCLKCDIIKRTGNKISINEKFKLQNVRVTKQMLQQTVENAKLNQEELNSFQNTIKQTYLQFQKQIMEKNPNFQEKIMQIKIDLDQQFNSLANYQKEKSNDLRSKIIINE